MKLTLSWLKEHLDTDASLYRIVDTLTMIGLEVESVEDKAKALAPYVIARVIEAVRHFFTADKPVAATRLRLERLFWQVLEAIGGRDGMSVPQLVTRLHDELAASGAAPDRTNFAPFLRASCARYLEPQLAGRIPADPGVPIRALDADWRGGAPALGWP